MVVLPAQLNRFLAALCSEKENDPRRRPGCQLRFHDDDHINRLGQLFVVHRRLVDIGANTIDDGCPWKKPV